MSGVGFALGGDVVLRVRRNIDREGDGEEHYGSPEDEVGPEEMGVREGGEHDVE